MHWRLKFRTFFVLFVFLWLPSPALAQLQMPSGNNAGVEELVKSAFSDAPLMVEVAKCESGLRQFGPSGMPLAGGSGGNYVGIFQISRGHATSALALGFDIYTAEGNIGYAKYMYSKQGTSPWVSCVPKDAAVAVVPASIYPALPTASESLALTSNLKLGSAGPQVLILQKLLNASGFVIAASGPGSPGNETDRFGSLTKEAVKKFQCSKGIVCGGNESTTGYGYVGPKTRQALNLAK